MGPLGEPHTQSSLRAHRDKTEWDRKWRFECADEVMDEAKGREEGEPVRKGCTFQREEEERGRKTLF